MTRQEAIQKLTEENHAVEPGQRYTVARFEPRDAWGVARIFFATYGAEYPVDSSYIPEKITEANANGTVYGVVGRTETGDVVAYAALYRSSSPNPAVYELGQYMVLPDYRNGMAIGKMTKLLLNEIAPQAGIGVIFGEAVCHHLATQKVCRLGKFADSAIEIGLLPATAYPREEYATERVSNLIQLAVIRDEPQTIYWPEVYRPWLDFILGDHAVQRTVAVGTGSPQHPETGLHEEFFSFAQVVRRHVQTIGLDFDTIVQAAEERYLAQGVRVFQYFISIAEPSIAHAVDLLRARGYFFGGYVPLWVGTDVIMMQKVLDIPDFGSIKLHSDRAREILEFVRTDIKNVTGVQM